MFVKLMSKTKASDPLSLLVHKTDFNVTLQSLSYKL